MAAIMLQAIFSFYAKVSEKILFISANTYENTLFVKTTASPITTKGRVFYPLVIIILYSLEKLRNCYKNWIRFVSPINTSTVYIPCSSTDSAEKLMGRAELCFTMFRGQSLLTKETEGWTKCRVLQKRDS